MSSIIIVDFSYIVSELCPFDLFVAILYSHSCTLHNSLIV